MNVLIIGGTNFIGPVLAGLLHEKQCRVYLLHRSHQSVPDAYTHIQGDCRNIGDMQKALEAASPDVIVHMVAYAESDIATLTKALCGKPTKTIVISSGDVYKGYQVLSRLAHQEPVPTPFHEQSPLRDILYPYRGKLDIDIAHDYEKLLVERAALQSPALQTTILRLGMVYGEHDPNRRFAEWIGKMAAGSPSIEIPKSYAGCRLCKSYVGNIAYGIFLAVEHAACDHVFNLSDRWVYTELEWLRLLAVRLNWTGEIVLAGPYMTELNASQDFILDTCKVRQELGYSEVINIDDALDRTIAWELSQAR